jgi:hypothetical protein
MHGPEIRDLQILLRRAAATAQVTDPATHLILVAAQQRIEQELAKERPRRSIIRRSLESVDRALKSVDRLTGLAEQVRSVAEKVMCLVS